MGLLQPMFMILLLVSPTVAQMQTCNDYQPCSDEVGCITNCAVGDVTCRSPQNSPCLLRRCVPNDECPPGWKYALGSCYKYSSLSVTWFQAKKFCQRFGGDLALVDSDEEFSYLVSHSDYGSSFYWVEGTDIQNDGCFVQLPLFQPIDFGDNTFNFVNSRVRSCLTIVDSGVFENVVCSNNLPFICERAPRQT